MLPRKQVRGQRSLIGEQTQTNMKPTDRVKKLRYKCCFLLLFPVKLIKLLDG